MIGVGVVGYGYWGPNLARNFFELEATRLVGVCDRDPARQKAAAARFPSAETFSDTAEMFARDDIDAVAIATPVHTHYPLALAALEAGKHVFVEKPMTSTSAESAHLIEVAEANGLTLMVDHTFLYTGAVQKIQHMISAGQLGEVYYYDSVRVNLGLFQSDVSVLWDLAVHDVSIMTHLIESRPVRVSATGMSHIQGQPENIAYLTVYFEDSVIGHIHVNWLAPVKLRRTLIGGSKQMIVFDDLEASEKVKIYDKGVTLNPSPDEVHRLLVGYRTGDMFAPKIDGGEALQVELAHFADCATTGKRPISDGRSGLEVVKILEAATASMARNGEPVALDAAEHFQAKPLRAAA